MTYTTIEQSQKLINWGLDPNTADMCYIKQLKTSPEGGVKLPYEFDDKYDKYPVFIGEETKGLANLPCWSLTALWDLMPTINNEFSQFIKVITKRTKKVGYFIYIEDKDKHKNINSGVYDTPIEAAIQMILHLIDYGYINKA